MKNKIIIIVLIVTICFSLALYVFFVTNAKNSSKIILQDYSVLQDTKFGGVFAKISIEDFNALGFEYGDSVDVLFSNGYELKDIPYYNGYYVDVGNPLVIGYPGYDYIKVGINYGDDLYLIAGLNENCTITITLNEKEKYKKEQLARDLHYSDEQGTKTDAEFANFRVVNVGNLKENILYRSASPCDNQHNRAPVVDKLINRAGIQFIINLSDNAKDLANHINKEDFNSPYFLSLYNKENVLPLSMSAQFMSDEFSQKLIEGLNSISQNDSPFLIHCVEGKDRTGFVCMIIEALAGAKYNEIVDDYMLTYANYYNITKETDMERYNIIKEKNIDTMLKYISNINSNDIIDLSTIDYEKNVTDFLISKGMTIEDIAKLKDKLTK